MSSSRIGLKRTQTIDPSKVGISKTRDDELATSRGIGHMRRAKTSDGRSRNRIEELKASLTKKSRRRSTTSSSNTPEIIGGTGRIQLLKEKLEHSIRESAQYEKSWQGKHWDNASDDEDDDGDQFKAVKLEKRDFREVYDESHNYWLSLHDGKRIPRVLRGKNRTLGFTKNGVSKRRLLSLKGMLQTAVLDQVDDNNRKERSQHNNDTTGSTHPLLQLMVSSTRTIVRKRQEQTGRMFQTHNNKFLQKQYDRAANKIQKFMKECMYVIESYRIERKHLKADIKDCKKRRKEELEWINAYVEEEKERIRFEMEQEFGKGIPEPDFAHYEKTTKQLQKEIAQEKVDYFSLMKDIRKLEQQREFYLHEMDNPDRKAVEKKIAEMEKDQDEWKRLQEYYMSTMDESNEQLDKITNQFYAMRQSRKRVSRTIKQIILLTQGMDGPSEDGAKMLAKINKLKTKRDAKFQQIKEARSQGLYPEDGIYGTTNLDDLDASSANIFLEPVVARQKQLANVLLPSVAEEPGGLPPIEEEKKSDEPPPPLEPMVAGFDDLYELGAKLGEGEFGAVYTCTHKQNGKERAVKIIDKQNMDKWDYDQVIKEFKMLTEIQNPNVIRVYEFYDMPDKFYIVQELAKGGELFDELIARGRLPEQDVATIMKRILDCVKHLAQNGIVHRDINLENILLDDRKGKYERVKLIDFGLATECKGDERLYELVGKARYIAPEVLGDNGYGLKADVWCCGVAAYTLLAGFHPFEADRDTDVYAQIVDGYIDFKDKVWDDVSAQAKDFVTKLLTYKEEERPTAAMALEHPWFTNNVTGLTFATSNPAYHMVWTGKSLKEVAEISASAVQSDTAKKREDEIEKCNLYISSEHSKKEELQASQQSLQLGQIGGTGDEGCKLAKKKSKRQSVSAEESQSIRLDDDDGDEFANDDSAGMSPVTSPDQDRSIKKKTKKSKGASESTSSFGAEGQASDNSSFAFSPATGKIKKVKKKKKKKREQIKDESINLAQLSDEMEGSFSWSRNSINNNDPKNKAPTDSLLGDDASMAIDFEASDAFDASEMYGSTRRTQKRHSMVAYGMSAQALGQKKQDSFGSSTNSFLQGSTLKKKNSKKDKKRFSKKKEEDEIAALMASRSNKLSSDDTFMDLLLSSTTKVALDKSTHDKEGKKLKGAALFKGATKALISGQRRAFAVSALTSGSDHSKRDDVPTSAGPSLLGLTAVAEEEHDDHDHDPLPKEKADTAPRPKMVKEKSANLLKLQGAVKDVMKRQRRGTALMSLISDLGGSSNMSDSDSETEAAKTEKEAKKKNKEKDKAKSKDDDSDGSLDLMGLEDEDEEPKKTGKQTGKDDGDSDDEADQESIVMDMVALEPKKTRKQKRQSTTSSLHDSALFSLITGL